MTFYLRQLGWIDQSWSKRLEVDPSDFLYCNTPEEVEQAIFEQFDNTEETIEEIVDYGIDSTSEIHEDFFEQWKKLKENGI